MVSACSNSVSEVIPAAGTTTLYQRNPAEAAVCKIHMFEAVPTTLSSLPANPYLKKRSRQVP